MFTIMLNIFMPSPILWADELRCASVRPCFDAVGRRQEGHPACKKLEWWDAGVVICLEQAADLHTAQLIPLSLTVSCFSKIQIAFIFVVPAHPGSPGQRATKRVCASVRACLSRERHSPTGLPSTSKISRNCWLHFNTFDASSLPTQNFCSFFVQTAKIHYCISAVRAVSFNSNCCDQGKLSADWAHSCVKSSLPLPLTMSASANNSFLVQAAFTCDTGYWTAIKHSIFSVINPTVKQYKYH